MLVAAMALLLSAAHGAPPPDYRGRPFDDAAYRASLRAEAEAPALPFRAYTEALTLWTGRSSTNGWGWVTGGGTNGFIRLDPAAADGTRVIHAHAALPNYRNVAFGWQWSAPGDRPANLLDYAAVSFSLKVTGPQKMSELFFGFTADQPAPLSLRPFQPSFADGNWHRVTLPVRAMKWFGETPGRTEIRGFVLQTFVWTAADFDLFVDHVTLERATNAPAAPTLARPPAAAAPHGQVIPGRLECAFYDLGGEGVSYHDTTPLNTLSAVLNQQPIHQRPHATSYHWNFRRDEGVDVSFVKDFADLNHTNRYDPPVNQLYIGGTEDGEWCNYTIEVRRAGTCQIIAAYGNVAGARPLRFSLDGQPAAECPCPVVTGSMHQWTREEVGRITFPEPGTHVLTLHYERGYNLGYFDFVEVQ